jgi:hypothetical protein
LTTHIQNNQKSIGKSIPAYGFKKSNPQTKSLETLPNVCDFPKENHIPGGMDFYFFVISISEEGGKRDASLI